MNHINMKKIVLSAVMVIAVSASWNAHSYDQSNGLDGQALEVLEIKNHDDFLELKLSDHSKVQIISVGGKRSFKGFKRSAGFLKAKAKGKVKGRVLFVKKSPYSNSGKGKVLLERRGKKQLMAKGFVFISDNTLVSAEKVDPSYSIEKLTPAVAAVQPVKPEARPELQAKEIAESQMVASDPESPTPNLDSIGQDVASVPEPQVDMGNMEPAEPSEASEPMAELQPVELTPVEPVH